MESMEQAGSLRARFMDGLQLVIKDAQDLLRGAGHELDEGYQVARAVAESAADSANEALKTADDYVQEHPWQAVGVGALAGLVVGMWIGRR